MSSGAEDAGRTRLTLPGTLDNGGAPALRESFLSALEAGTAVVVAGAAVERVSTPCLQVMLARAAAVADAGRDFALAQPSEALISAFDDLGLFPVLMKWKIEP